MLPGTEANAMSGIIRTYMNFHLILSRLLRMLMWNCQRAACNISDSATYEYIWKSNVKQHGMNIHQAIRPKDELPYPPHKGFSRICKLFSSDKETSIHSCMRTSSHLLWCNNESFAHWPTYFRDIHTHKHTEIDLTQFVIKLPHSPFSSFQGFKTFSSAKLENVFLACSNTWRE